MSRGAGDWQITTIDSATLIQRLADPRDEQAWHAVEERYGPLVHAFARRLGLSLELADDARQNTMLAIVEAIRGGRYERGRGRLRAFIFGIARNKILDLRTVETQHARAGAPDATRLAAATVDGELERVFEREWQVAVAAQCLREARAHFTADTYEMFYLRAIEGRSSAEVAARIGKSVSAVDGAVHRVRDYLRAIRARIEEVF
jgi:RNA polymerase sigma-70 factor (ECF subfamily)